MQLSVIILNYNAVAFLELCLYSVFRAIEKIDAQVIVVDNDSQDNSCEMIRQHFPQVELIENSENLGFSAGNNIGVSGAMGEFVCILNPDTIVGEQVFENVLAFSKANPKTAFTSLQLIDGRGTFLPESKRHVPKPKVALRKLLGDDSLYYYNELNKDDDGEVSVVVGAFILCRKDIYMQLGGFDERYFMYGEDIDLCFTALQSGFQNYYLGSNKAIHFKGESTVKDKIYLNRFYGAMQLFYDKHLRQSGMQRALVKMGVAFLKNRVVTSSEEKVNFNMQILISNDADFSLETAERISFNQLMSFEIQDCVQIVWDLKSLNITDVINFMVLNSSDRLSYRFINSRRTFMLGSDSSTGRGKVINL